MHLRTHQQQSSALAAGYTTSAAAQNLIQTADSLVRRVIEAETGKLAAAEDIAAMAGSLLFNLTLLADRLGLDVEDIAVAHLRRLELATASGRLRVARGENETNQSGDDG